MTELFIDIMLFILEQNNNALHYQKKDKLYQKNKNCKEIT